MIKLQSIRIKLLFIFLLVSLLPVVILGILSIMKTQTSLKKEIFNKLLLLSEAKEGQVFAFLDSIKSETIVFSSDSFIKESLKTNIATPSSDRVESMNNYLLERKKLYETLVGIFIMDTEGKIVASTKREEIGKDERDDKYFMEGKKSIYVGDFMGNKHPHFGLDNFFVVTSPLKEAETGKLIGVIANIYDTNKLHNILGGEFQLEKGALTAHGGQANTLEVYLVNKEKKMFVHPHDINEKNHEKHFMGMIIDTLPVKKCLENQEETEATYKNYDGTEVTGSSMCLTKEGWVLITEISTKEAFIPIMEMKETIGLIVIIFSLGVILTAFFFAQKISLPIRKLHEAAEIVAKGNLDYQVDIRTEDEIGQLGNAFNLMTADLKKYLGELEKHKTELEKKVKERTEELEETKNKDEAILTSIGEAVVACDKKGRIMLFNPAAEELTGFLSSETIGKEHQKYFKFETEEGKSANDVVKDSIKGNKKTKKENSLFLIKKNNQKIPVAINGGVIKNSKGEEIGCVSVFRDISIEREIDQMKTEFVSVASHQLRTPLTAMKWFSEMLLSGDAGKLNKEQEKFIRNIDQSNERMISLVNSLLNIARIESGRIIIDPCPINLEKLIREVISELKRESDRKKQTLIISCHPRLPKVNIDPKLIRHVYMNLLSNAIKYTQDGGEISVFISRKDDQIISQISDNGLGIPEKEHSQVFQKFFRCENAVRAQPNGTGLGLYLVKTIVESSSGKIWFKSVEGKGTTFWVSLPLSGTLAKKGEVTLEG